jgi:hypothetical protein
VNRYNVVRELVFRLLEGETVDVTDEHGRVWRGTSSELSLVQPGNGAVGLVLSGVDAYTVALRLASVGAPDVAAEPQR